MLLSRMGEHERALALVTRAMDLNPFHPGWCHMVADQCRYLRGEDQEALQLAKRLNMPGLVWGEAFLASVCARLGRREEACAAVRRVEAMQPAFRDVDVLLVAQDRWYWSREFAEPYNETYLEAVAWSREP
jgi:hypothetical protein